MKVGRFINKQNMEMNSRNSSFTTWAIIAILGLLGLNGYQWYTNNNLQQKSTVQVANISELEKAQAELDQDYQGALDRLEEMRGDNKEANDLIESQKRDLLAQKSKISELIWTKKELDKAKSEIAKFKVQTEEYVAQITNLKNENSKLTDANVQLTNTNQTLSTNLETTTKERDEVSQAKAILTSEKEKLSSENAGLSSQVDMASAIKINAIDVKGFEVKDDGKVKGKDKAKDIEMLRVCFTTETNMVTKAGGKRFFIRVVNPLGETVVQEDKSAGTLTNKLDKTDVRYSTSADIQYDNKDTNACADWTLSNKLTKGDYKVELYNNGFMVGKGAFKLK
jgi:hypothetical protein